MKILAGTKKGLFILTQNKHKKWEVTQKAFLGSPVTAVLANDHHFLVALKHGHFGCKLHRSLNQGISWEEVSVPKYPPLPEGREPDKCPMRGIDIPWNLEQIWCLASGGETGELWCGTIPGGLFYSGDSGENWSINENLWNHPKRLKWMGGGYDYPGIHSICVSSDNPFQVTLAVSCGGVWQTKDKGLSWSLIGQGLRADYSPPDQAYIPDTQDVHLMVQCALSPDHMWVQHHNGIFKSEDRGHSFTEITGVSPSVFGFTVAVHPRDPKTVWFVPAKKDEERIPVDGKLVATRSSDGGKTFKTLMQGLPQTEAYDLIYRHGLAINASGDDLAFGSTTGSLWVSSDQGDSWSLINAHFPPIHTVSIYDHG